jgi:hypothetical protein
MQSKDNSLTKFVYCESKIEKDIDKKITLDIASRLKIPIRCSENAKNVLETFEVSYSRVQRLD